LVRSFPPVFGFFPSMILYIIITPGTVLFHSKIFDKDCGHQLLLAKRKPPDGPSD
jgi:hypothetical protein